MITSDNNTVIKKGSMFKKQQQAQVIQLTLEQKSEQFIEHIVNGQQMAAEALLKPLTEQDRNLLLTKSYTVVDPAGRTFKDVTVLQYAVWALDKFMWDMLLKHLSHEEAKNQIQAMSNASWIAQYGPHADWSSLSTTLINHVDHQTPIENALTESKADSLTTHFIHEVGRQQRLLPMHVIQTFCTPGEKWWSSHSFLTDTIRHEGIETKIHNFLRPNRYANWYQNYDQISIGRKRYLGDGVAYFRGETRCPRWKVAHSVMPSYMYQTTGENGATETHSVKEGDYFKLLAIDAKAFSVLYMHRKAQYEELLTRLQVNHSSSADKRFTTRVNV